jgi:hypothetical protein
MSLKTVPAMSVHLTFGDVCKISRFTISTKSLSNPVPSNLYFFFKNNAIRVIRSLATSLSDIFKQLHKKKKTHSGRSGFPSPPSALPPSSFLSSLLLALLLSSKDACEDIFLTPRRIAGELLEEDVDATLLAEEEVPVGATLLSMADFGCLALRFEEL